MAAEIGTRLLRGATLKAVDGCREKEPTQLCPPNPDIDHWIGYGRKLADKVDWRIQLNVRSVGKGNDLIPITTQPDGTPAGYRIAPRQYWSLTNTFRF